MAKCKICMNGFKESSDMVIMCAHHGSPVHMGCCVDKCSMNKEPCMHCEAMYKRMN
jgi:hypothetical protein